MITATVMFQKSKTSRDAVHEVSPAGGRGDILCIPQEPEDGGRKSKTPRIPDYRRVLSKQHIAIVIVGATGHHVPTDDSVQTDGEQSGRHRRHPGEVGRVSRPEPTGDDHRRRHLHTRPPRLLGEHLEAGRLEAREPPPQEEDGREADVDRGDQGPRQEDIAEEVLLGRVRHVSQEDAEDRGRRGIRGEFR